MTSEDDPTPDESEEAQPEALWDALEVLRGRAAATRADRDGAISELRQSMSDDEVREYFGIDLPEIEG